MAWPRPGPGRPKGSPNKLKLEAANWCRTILQGEEYRKSVEERIKARTLPPQIEQLLWAYGYGKPTENVSLEVSHVDNDELLARRDEQLLAEATELAQLLAANLETARANDDQEAIDRLTRENAMLEAHLRDQDAAH